MLGKNTIPTILAPYPFHWEPKASSRGLRAPLVDEGRETHQADAAHGPKLRVRVGEGLPPQVLPRFGA